MKTVVRSGKEGMLIQNNKLYEIKAADVPNSDGFTPIELLTGSLGLCVFISISRMLERDGIKWQEDELNISVTAEKAEKGPSRVEQFKVEVAMPASLDKSYRNKLLRSAEKACTIGNTLKNGATIYLREREGE